MPATTPYCMKAPMRLASFAVMYGSRLRFLISPPKWVGKLGVSKRSLGAMPLPRARMFDQAPATSLPTGETIPRPVMTTRRLLNRGSGLALVRIDIVDRLLDGGDFLGVLVRDFRLEFFLERHHQFHGVQRVGPQIVYERGIIGDFFFFHAQLFGHDLFNLLLNSTHRYGVLSELLFMRFSEPPRPVASTGRVFYVNAATTATLNA